MMKTLHIVPEKSERNGVYVVASFLAEEDGGDVVLPSEAQIDSADMIWVHGAWLPSLWLSAFKTMVKGKHLVRMPHGSFSPIYLKRSGRLKKLAVSPLEKFILRKSKCVVATCDAEADWILSYCEGLENVEKTDVKRFFDFSNPLSELKECDTIKILYLGRRHPLKGVDFLETAVAKLNQELSLVGEMTKKIELRVEDALNGQEKENAFAWSDCLVLPSESENFGLVVAEALERGKRVITTDGAPAWEGDKCGDKLLYIKGYVGVSRSEKEKLLKDAITDVFNLGKMRVENNNRKGKIQ
jgi:glycosyltransferase involved in cell wall biosynthesis